MKTAWLRVAAGVCALCSYGCSSSNSSSSGAGGKSSSTTSAATTTGASGSMSSGGTGGASAQTPPQGRAAVEAWLAQGAYKSWHCETAVHVARSPSPHGFDRVCSNDLIAANATGTAPWPQGAAAVKELYASTTDTTPNGYAVYLKTQANSAAGANWYFYERVPLSSTVPHDANGVVADGIGASFCVPCHSAAGSDAAHTPTPGGRDEVYTPVP